METDWKIKFHAGLNFQVFEIRFQLVINKVYFYLDIPFRRDSYAKCEIGTYFCTITGLSDVGVRKEGR